MVFSDLESQLDKINEGNRLSRDVKVFRTVDVLESAIYGAKSCNRSNKCKANGGTHSPTPSRRYSRSEWSLKSHDEDTSNAV